MPNDHPAAIGRSMANRKAATLVAGRGCFTDDIRLENPLHIAFLRSPVADGQLLSLEIEEAAAAPGVHAVHGGADVAHLGRLSINAVLPLEETPGFPLLARERIDAVGQPLAAVLADTAARAQDACDLIYPEIDEAAETPTPSRLAARSWREGDVEAAFAGAATVVETRIQHPRLAPSPMEPRAIAVAYDPAGDGVTVWQSTQTPHRSRNELADILDIQRDRIRVVAPDVGGAFGMKASLYPEEVFAVWAALHHQRNVRWTASRSEDFLSASHGRGIETSGRLALDAGGNLLALEARVEAPLGRWLPNSALIPAWNAARVLPGGYRVPAVDIETGAIAHNLAPTGIYRGAGRPEANCLIERLVDKAARAAGQDPFSFRKRNLLAAAELPYRTATGNLLDSGDYAAALDLLREKAGYDDLLSARDSARGAGRLSGVGVAFCLEPSGSGWESAEVTWHADGRVTVASGSSSQGHGRETALAQIAADALGVAPEAVEVRCGDSATCPEGIGALASRSTSIGGSAVLAACRELIGRREAGEALPLSTSLRYENDGQAWGYGAYLVALEIDRDTGETAISKAVCVDDTGVIVNPAMVEGQVRGGFAQGLGEALMEAVVYDDDNQLLTGSFMDYALPRAGDVPPLEIHKTETPSPMNILGAKGVGEAGTIGAPAAILNAALDALAPLGVEELQMPLTPNKLWHAIQAAEKERQE